jgi:hypothetical protein
MAGYLDAYGVADQRRERRIKRIVIWGLSTAVTVAILYFGLRTRSQEQVMSQFLDELAHQKYQDAYKLWGCPENCKYYPPDKFLEDWGPSGKYAKISHEKIEHVDYCDDGVVFDLNLPDNDGLWVNRSTNFISFYDSPRCPGRHLQLGAFLKSLFS